MKTRSLWLQGMVFVLGLCLPFIATADGEVDNCCDYILANYMICDPDSYGSVCYCEGQKRIAPAFPETQSCESSHPDGC
jgi:hypothetical protein